MSSKMKVKRKVKRYVTNLISFTNSRMRNALRDRSAEFFAGDVTQELEECMRRVWQPIVGPDHEVLVFHIHKPRNVTSLGLSLHGVTHVLEPQFAPDNGNTSTPADKKTVEPAQEQVVSRHFVDSVLPDGLIGSLNVIRPGDELLQANGRRLRGASYSSCLRCLRSLPGHIELVVSRSLQDSPDAVPLPTVDDPTMAVDTTTMRVRASDVGSVDTERSLLMDQPSPRAAAVLANGGAGSDTLHRRVSDWIRRSQTDVLLDRLEPWISSTEEEEGEEGFRTGSVSMRLPPVTARINPNFGLMRPAWMTVPLLVQLDKSKKNGFGFSLSEYEDIEPDRQDGGTVPRARRASLSLHRSASLPPVRNRGTGSLRRRGRRGHRQHMLLLIDSLAEGGAAQLDGRIAVGDRLLFVNDRSLARATLREAELALRAAPTGPCLLGIAKLHFQPNVAMSNAGLKQAEEAQKDLFDVELNGDHPLDFNLMPAAVEQQLDWCKHLHSRHLRVPPLPNSDQVERHVRVRLNAAPIGVRLDALAAGGVDGCRVVHLLPGGALARARVLGPNDYITELNGIQLRLLSNDEVFEIIRQVSQESVHVSITFIPAQAVEAHRACCLKQEQAEGSPLNNHEQSLPDSCIGYVDPVRQLTLERPDTEGEWGMVLEDCDPAGVLPWSLAHQCSSAVLVTQLVSPESAAAKGGVRAGDWILRVNDSVPVSADSLRDVFHSSGCSLRLTVYRPEQTREWDRSPEPLTELDSRDELNVLSRSLADQSLDRITYPVCAVEPQSPPAVPPRTVTPDGPGVLDAELAQVPQDEDVVRRYTRRPEDLVVRVSLRPSTDGLGIRLVGCRDLTEQPTGTFVAGCAAQVDSGLCVGDELVQIGSTCVEGADQLTVHRELVKAAAAVAPDPIQLVVRRNPRNTRRMSFCPQPAEETQQVSNGLPSGDSQVPMEVTQQLRKCLADSLDSMDVFNVQLQRKERGFGLFIVNFGPQNEEGVFVNELAPGGSAAALGLRPQDRILAVDGAVLLDYDSTLLRMQHATAQVLLTIGRAKPPRPPPKQLTGTADSARPIQIRLQKRTDGLGFSIVGGTDTLLHTVRVHDIHPGKAAAKDGRLKVGDRLLSVNGISLEQVTHQEATDIIRSAGDNLDLLVSRDGDGEEPSSAASTGLETIEVLLKRVAGESLGLALVSRSPYSTGTAIGNVLEDSPAERSGLLQAGDVILEVNGKNVTASPSQEVATLFKNSKEHVTLKVQRMKTPEPKLFPPACPSHALRPYVVALRRPTEEQQQTNSYGMHLVRASPKQLQRCPAGHLLVERLDPGGPADCSGMILPGDRLLSIDREPVDWLDPEEVSRVLSGLQFCTLELGRPANDRLVPSLHLEDPEDAQEEAEEDDEEEEEVDALALPGSTGFSLDPVELPWARDPISDRLGIRLMQVGSGISGPVICRIKSGSAAAQSALQVGDRILGLDERLLLSQQRGQEDVLSLIERVWLERSKEHADGQDVQPVRLTIIRTPKQVPNGDLPRCSPLPPRDTVVQSPAGVA